MYTETEAEKHCDRWCMFAAIDLGVMEVEVV
jgi:hypothetical protein